MNARRTMLTLTLAAGVLGASGLAQAARVEFEVNVAPPPDRVEVVPAPRPGYIWEGGYWRWDNGRYVWNEGRFIEEREGHRYTPHRWEHEGERFRFHGGHWDDD